MGCLFWLELTDYGRVLWLDLYQYGLCMVLRSPQFVDSHSKSRLHLVGCLQCDGYALVSLNSSKQTKCYKNNKMFNFHKLRFVENAIVAVFY